MIQGTRSNRMTFCIDSRGTACCSYLLYSTLLKCLTWGENQIEQHKNIARVEGRCSPKRHLDPRWHIWGPTTHQLEPPGCILTWRHCYGLKAILPTSDQAHQRVSPRKRIKATINLVFLQKPTQNSHLLLIMKPSIVHKTCWERYIQVSKE